MNDIKPIGLKIKVCGMRSPGNIREIASLHPDFLGFIDHAPSPRSISGCAEDALSAAVGGLPPEVNPVLVTVDMDEGVLAARARRLGFGILQLHGDESPAECRRLRENGYTVWKTLHVGSAGSLGAARNYEGCADMLVLDTKSAAAGGSGKKFDWSLLEGFDPGVPFMLGGGVSPEDARTIAKLEIPAMAGVDINSRFETSPGVKDPSAVSAFINALKSSR